MPGWGSGFPKKEPEKGKDEIKDRNETTGIPKNLFLNKSEEKDEDLAMSKRFPSFGEKFIEKKEDLKVESRVKRDIIEVDVEEPKVEKQISKEEQRAHRDKEEEKFIEGIENKFHKFFIKAQYNMANEINDALTDFDHSGISYPNTLIELLPELNNYISKAKALGIGIDEIKDELAENVDSTKLQFDQFAKAQQYWNTAKESQNQSDITTRNKLGKNNLFSERTEKSINTGEKILKRALRFLHILKDMTSQSRSLNEKFEKPRAMRIKGSNEDPFLKTYNKSGVMQRLMRENKSKKNIRKSQQSLRGSQKSSVDVAKKRSIYNNFINELTENDGYLLNIL